MINRLFVNIYGNVGNNIQDTSTAMATIIKGYVNDIYFDFLKQINHVDINTDYNFNTVAGTRDYVLPNNFGKEIYVYNSSSKTNIPFISLQELVRDYASSLGDTGQVQMYTILLANVRKQPTSSSTLSIVSSSASDSTQTVRIKGTDSNGVELDESVTLNGTTPATTANSYVEIRSISKSATTVGRITVTSNAGAVTVAVMAPADLAYSVKIIRLTYTPDSVFTISVPYVIDPYPLVSDYDQPVIDCVNVLELGATMKAWRYKRQFQKAQDYEIQYMKAVETYIWNQENQPNQTHQFGILPQPRDDY